MKCQLQQKLNWDVKTYRSKLEKVIPVIINSVVACFNVRTINHTKIIIDNKGPPECKSSWWGQAYLEGIICPPRLEYGQCSDAGTGGARGATDPPIFGRSVNPIPTGEDRLSPPITTGTSNVFHLPASLQCI